MNLLACYKRAWKGFARWWVPLCAVALIFVVTQNAASFFAQKEMTESGLMSDVMKVVKAKSASERQYRSEKLNKKAMATVKTAGFYLLISLPIVIPVAVLLIIYGMTASSDDGMDLKKDTAQAGRRGIQVILAQILGTVLTVLPGTLLFMAAVLYIAANPPAEGETIVGNLLIVLFTFIVSLLMAFCAYIAFFFAPQLAADEELNAFAALARSQRMVRGSLFSVVGLVLINTFIQGLSALTVIGLIPATAFANTARGAAYHQLRAAEKAKKAAEAQA